MHLLSGDMLRHTELRQLIRTVSAARDISQRVLTLKLRILDRDGDGAAGPRAVRPRTPRQRGDDQPGAGVRGVLKPGPLVGLASFPVGAASAAIRAIPRAHRG